MRFDIEDEDIKRLLERIKKNPELLQQVYFLLVQYFAEKSDLRSILSSLEQMEERMEKRFAKIDERFAKIDERFAKIDERLEELRREMNERFAKIDERFAKIDERFAKIDERFAKIDERFAKVDERFEELRREMNERFERQDAILNKIMSMVKEIHRHLGSSLTGLVRTFIKRELMAKGFTEFELRQNITFIDEEKRVHHQSTEFEVDLFCKSPLVIVEVTGILKDLHKVEVFVRKVNFLKKKYHDAPIGVIALVATEIREDLLDTVQSILQSVNAELITKEEILRRLEQASS